ncbi:alginate lyase family protein [Microbacterium karelineae]|uniref:alginate lyase family protein n=1 Tax=Microbacterium karelineae TaxID=2654283 RepID=UPI0018D3DF25|nr:alginate lyase family protein [Microbacterium karelineae]
MSHFERRRPTPRARSALASVFAAAALVGAGIVPAVADDSGGILDDTYVRSIAPETNFGTASNYVIGKGGHAYIRIDVSDVDLDDTSAVELDLTKYNNAADVIVTRADDHLTSDGEATSTPWDELNVTYDTRPIDVADAPVIEIHVPAGESRMTLDLRDLVADAQADGEDALAIHITTSKVDDHSVSGTDIHSTRSIDSAKTPWLRVVRDGEERPVPYPVEQPFGDYFSNGAVAQDVVRIATADGYASVDASGRITLVDEAEAASLFAIHGFDYVASEYDGTGGAQLTTYAIKSLSNGKYLTIQNYDGDRGRPYYREADGAFAVTATAPDVQWNERFDVALHPTSGEVSLRTHADSLRDESEPVTAPVQLTKAGAHALPGDREQHRLEFEHVDAGLLDVQHRVSGTSAHLEWLPVRGDDDPDHYEVDGARAVRAENGVMRASVDGLETGRSAIAVEYTGGDEPLRAVTEAQIFSHPGVSHSTEQLDAMREHVANGEEPWHSDYVRLRESVPNDISSLGFSFTAREAVGRGNPEGSGNIADYEESSAAAYFDALQWVITGDERYAEKAVEILNAWSQTLTQIDGRDQILGAGLSTVKLINAAEIVRYYDGGFARYADEDFAAFQQLMLDVVYPVVQDAGAPMIANGNWDQAAIAAVEAIGVVTDNAAIFDRAVGMYQSPFINGSIENYVSDWGQSAESARDQAHAQLGIGLLGDIAAIAWNQDVDLWSSGDNKLARAFNWAAEYNLFGGEGSLRAEPIPNIFGRRDGSAYWTDIDAQRINRGQLRPVYETALAHYSKVDGVDVTWMERAAAAMRPEGFVHFDNLNFATLTSYDGPAQQAASPFFQMRTMLTPWWQSRWDEVEAWGEVSREDRALTPGGVIPDGLDEETLTSYFSVQDDGTLAVDTEQDEAPFFQLVTNDDETYSIREVETGRFLGVSRETVDGEDLLTADGHQVGAEQKFELVSWGVGRFYLTHDDRAVRIDVDGDPALPAEATLSLRLSDLHPTRNTDTSAENWFVFTYGTPAAATGLEIEASTRCVGGRAVLSVTADNLTDEAVRADVVTAYGARPVPVAAGNGRSMVFATRQSAVESGTVTVTTQSGTNVFAPYDARTCG